MANERLMQHVLLKVCTFASTTDEVVISHPEALQGTSEALLDLVISELLVESQDDEEEDNEEVKKIEAAFRTFQKDNPFRALLHNFASDPSHGLADAGPHLVFAEAWTNYAIARWVVERAVDGGRVNGEDFETIAYACCTLFAKWSKSGYRLDWNPMNSDKQKIESTAPVGKWTKR